MIRVDPQAWTAMLVHAEEAYPNECCGAMFGRFDADGKVVTRAERLVNSYEGSQAARYEIRPEDLLEADRRARAEGLDLIGIYHSHPDCDAYFSETDLKNSCPWYSFVVLSIRNGRFAHANCFLPNPDQTVADPEPLHYPEKTLWQES